MSNDYSRGFVEVTLRIVAACASYGDLETVARKMLDGCISDAERMAVTKACMTLSVRAAETLQDLERERGDAPS